MYIKLPGKLVAMGLLLLDLLRLNHNKPKKMQQKQQTFKKSYASAVRNKENTSTMQEGSNFPTHLKKTAIF